jgi:regulatory protein
MPFRRRDTPAPEPLSPAGARLTAITLLSRRDYTAHEIQIKLVERGASVEDAAATVASLVAARMIDDGRTAAAQVRTATHIKGRGRHRIARELSARGIDKALVHQTLADLTPEDEAAQIRRILAAKRVPAEPDPATRQKLFQHLMRRGFSTDVIARVLRTPLDE